VTDIIEIAIVEGQECAGMIAISRADLRDLTRIDE
jgi:hypothetical protein